MIAPRSGYWRILRRISTDGSQGRWRARLARCECTRSITERGLERQGAHMAEITARRRGELVRAVFKVLLDHPDGLPANDVLRRVEDQIQLTDFEKSDFSKHPG